MRACGACFYGRFAHGEDEGECMDGPPLVFLTHDGLGEAVFTHVRPSILRDDYCRDFSHRAGPKEAQE